MMPLVDVTQRTTHDLLPSTTAWRLFVGPISKVTRARLARLLRLQPFSRILV
jgi:hypothetical protein